MHQIDFTLISANVFDILISYGPGVITLTLSLNGQLCNIDLREMRGEKQYIFLHWMEIHKVQRWFYNINWLPLQQISVTDNQGRSCG